MQIARMFCTAALFSVPAAKAFATTSAAAAARAPSLTLSPRAAFGLVRQTLAPTVSSTSSSSVAATSTRMMSTVAPADFIKTENESNKVVIYSKSYCPFCTQTKDLFKNMGTGTAGVEAKVYELDKMPDGAEIQSALAELTGQRTVPNVFVAGQHIGGNSEAQAAASAGTLKTLLGL